MRPRALDARRLCAVLVTTFVVAAVVQPNPAEAQAAPLEVLAGGRDTTSQWAAYTIRSNGGEYRVDWTLDVNEGPLQVGAYFYTGDDMFTAGFNWTAFTYQDSSYYDVNVVPGGPIAGEPTVDADGYTQTVSIGGLLFGSPEAPKITKVLIWASGDLTRGSEWELSATPDARLVTDEAGDVVMTRGTNAFVHLSQDFEGTATAGVQRRIPPTPLGYGVGARAAAMTSRTVEVEHGLVGSFRTLGQGTPYSAGGYGMQVAGPDGYQQSCSASPCLWYTLKPPSALRPGTYRFDLTGGGAGIGTFGDAILWGVDAHLPPGGDPDPVPFVTARSVVEVPGGLNVSGRASFPSTTMTRVTDPEDDGAAPAGAADVLGAELAGGSWTYNPDDEELMLRWDLSTHLAGSAGLMTPAVLYAKELRVGGTRYEVRVLKGAATSPAPTLDDTGVYMALFRCAPECAEQTRLEGSFSWLGREFVLVDVPLSAISASEGSSLTGLRSFTAIGEASPGSVMPIDEVSFPSALVPDARVEVGIAPASTPEDEVVFDAGASLAGGAFSQTLPTDGLPTGRYRVWTRPCLGLVCGAAAFDDVTL